MTRNEIRTDKKANAAYWDRIDGAIEHMLGKVADLSVKTVFWSDYYGDGIIPAIRELVVKYFEENGGEYPFVNENM